MSIFSLLLFDSIDDDDGDDDDDYHFLHCHFLLLKLSTQCQNYPDNQRWLGVSLHDTLARGISNKNR